MEEKVFDALAEIEMLTEDEMVELKGGGSWVYKEGKWVWIEDTR